MFNLNASRRFFALLRTRFESQRDSLNALDAAIGDGDHGFTVTRAFTAAEFATRQKFSTIGEMFDVAAQALAESAGGAIGPLLAALFAEGGIAFSNKQVASTGDFIQFLTNGLQAVEDVGGARLGDKTLIDALAPAAVALQNAKDQPLKQGLQLAKDAAEGGAVETAKLIAIHGRAHFLGERSRGHVDAGATSMVLILAALMDALIDQEPEEFSNTRVEYKVIKGKFTNHPDEIVRQDNEGLVLVYPDLVSLTDKGILVRSQRKESGKVGLAIGHGGGHTPSMGGFVGPGLLDADVYGPVFTCASGISIAQAISEANFAAGVVLLVSNHSGDVLNAKLALRRAIQIGIRVKAVYLCDDIATAPRENYQTRRGLGGMLFALKIGGAAAEEGKSLDEVVRLMERVNERTATLAVAVSPPTHPATGIALFELPNNQIEVGTGVHGEMGVYRGPHLPADKLIDMLVERLLDDLEPFGEHQYLAFINGAGGTSKMELHILYRRLSENLTSRGLTLFAGVADSLFTTQEMGGFSLSLCAVDEEMLSYWQAFAAGPSFHWPHC